MAESLTLRGAMSLIKTLETTTEHIERITKDLEESKEKIETAVQIQQNLNVSITPLQMALKQTLSDSQQ